MWLLGVIGALLLVATSAIFLQSHRDYARAITAERINLAMDDMVLAAGDWGRERALVIAALDNPEPASPAARARILALRLDGVARFEAALERLQRSGIVLPADLLARYHQREDWADRLRRGIDRDVASPTLIRDVQRRGDWFRVSTDAIDASQQLRIDCGARLAAAISLVVSNLSLRHDMWLMTEYAGRERSTLAQIIAARRPISPDELRTLASYRGHVLEGWNVVSHFFADDPRLDEAVPQLARVENQFFGSYEIQRRRVYSEGTTGHYSLSSREWMEHSTMAIDAIMALQTITQRDVRHAALIEEQQDEWLLALAVCIAAFGSFLLAVCLWLFLRNVFVPLRDLTAIAQAISGGDAGDPAETPYLASVGEIGALARGLRQARESMQRQREAEAERLMTQQDLARLAHYDPLTGLANRVLFASGIETALALLEQAGHGFALLCLDLDGFKLVNDTHGHAVGDALLCEVAQRLRGCLRTGDMLARMGGDEFAVIQDVVTRTDAQLLCQRIVDAVRGTFRINEVQISIGVTIGIAFAPENGRDFISLLARADMAMYKAKSEGKNRWHFYDVALDRSLQQRVRIEHELKDALALGQLCLHYQPQIDLRTNMVTGCEALLRWDHPDLGKISPITFIPIAEETGQIADIGAWVIEQAACAAAAWSVPWRIAVNVSAIQFRERRVLGDVTRALERSGIDPGRLELEITEHVIMMNTVENIAILKELRAMGVRLAMDDFGTGYSSLSYLRQFKFDKIKIDQSFIRDLPANRESAAIIRATTEMADSLGISVTAEGTETHAQLEMVRTLGCHEAQGYLIGRPLPITGPGAPWEANDRPEQVRLAAES